VTSFTRRHLPPASDLPTFDNVYLQIGKSHINLKSMYQGMWSTKFIELDAGVWKIPFHKIRHIL